MLFIVDESEAKIGISKKFTYPANAPDALTVIIGGIRLALLLLYAAFFPPAITGILPFVMFFSVIEVPFSILQNVASRSALYLLLILIFFFEIYI